MSLSLTLFLSFCQKNLPPNYARVFKAHWYLKHNYFGFFGKTGWYYYWGNNTLLKAKTTDWLGLNRLIATARILFVFRPPAIKFLSKRAYKSRQKVDIRVFWFFFFQKWNFLTAFCLTPVKESIFACKFYCFTCFTRMDD